MVPFKNLNKPIAGIIFDLDGTLYHMKWYMRPAMFLWLFPFSYRLPKFIKTREKLVGTEYVSCEVFYRALGDACTKRAPSLTANGWINWIQHDFYKAFVCVMKFMRNSRPQLEETLTLIRNKGIKIGVLSDYGKVKERLVNLHISPKNFDAIVSSEECGALKPHPGPFLKIALEWDIDPGLILVVGDRPDTDGLGAKAAGMHYLQITDAKKLAQNAFTWHDFKKILLTLSAYK